MSESDDLPVNEVVFAESAETGHVHVVVPECVVCGEVHHHGFQDKLRDGDVERSSRGSHCSDYGGGYYIEPIDHDMYIEIPAEDGYLGSVIKHKETGEVLTDKTYLPNSTIENLGWEREIVDDVTTDVGKLSFVINRFRDNNELENELTWVSKITKEVSVEELIGALGEAEALIDYTRELERELAKANGSEPIRSPTPEGLIDYIQDITDDETKTFLRSAAKPWDFTSNEFREAFQKLVETGEVVRVEGDRYRLKDE